MYQEITKDMFRDEFKRCGRGNQFSYEALGHLYDWLEEVYAENPCGMELDVIALCCDFAESTFDEIRSDYRNKFEPDATNEELLKELQNETCVVWHDNLVVLYQQF